MKQSHVRSFWFGFAITAALTMWIYWLWRQKREVAPDPLIVSGSPATPAKVVAPAIKQQPVVVSEPLEVIKGIGPVFANRLNDAGIYTFADLASRTPDELREITKATGWDPAEWIAEARRLEAEG